MSNNPKNLIYAGKVKSLYTTDQESELILEFRDNITAFNGIKHEKLAGKGRVNNLINSFLMGKLNQAGIQTHFIKYLDETNILIRRLNMIPLKSIMRNIAAGRFCRHFGITVGRRLTPPLYELYLKSDELRDPLVSDYHAITLGWAKKDQLSQMAEISFAVNKVLTQIFAEHDMILIDFKLEFGLLDNKILLADELDPDTCRIWDSVTHEALDKDRFRQDLGGVVSAYEEVAKRFKIL